MNSLKNFTKIILVAIFLYLFLVSIGLMEAAFKGFGKGFAESLLNTTSNPFTGLLIGILVTSLVQSSSTTTSIAVGMVASGIITIGNAVPIIMGANIGTTVTSILVALGHITRREEFKRAVTGATVHDFFNLICVAIMFPLELATGFLQKSATILANLFVHFGGIEFTSPIKTITRPLISLVKDLFTKILVLPHNLSYIFILILAIFVLFISLYFIVKLMKSLVIKRTETVLNNVIEKQGLLGLFAGLIFTAIVQSSSITTSLLVPLMAAGIITVEAVFPITLGANIGTTITAILASFATGNIAAVTVAFVHVLFNLIGVVCIYPIKIIRKIPLRLAKNLGELAFKKRKYVMIYVVSVFFLTPFILIMVSKLFK